MRTTTGLLFASLFCLMTACTNESGTGTKTTEPGTPPAAEKDADNTARNADTSALSQTTPADQGENEADLKISAAVRKAVVDDNSLSVNAHNVKIVTAGGVVTLRGPVKTEQEKTTIESKAKQVAGVTRVDNLLEVEKNDKSEKTEKNP
jgi:osmotically-inducible protein OsmY